MKERLTGAIILVALIVLLVPELLSGPPRGGTASSVVRGKPAVARVASPLAAPDSTAAAADPTTPSAVGSQPPVRSYTLPLGVAAAPTAASGVLAAQGPTAKPAQPVAGAAAPLRPQSSEPVMRSQPSLPATAVPPRASQPASPVSRPVAARGWVVQVGYFSQHSNALHLAHRLRDRGFRVTVSEHRVKGRSLWRVWSGPVRSHAEALHLARRLRSAGPGGEVLPQ